MAEVLIKAVDDGTPGGWRRGDAIDIRPDGYAWGASEGDPAISYVVHITDAAPGQLARYLTPRLDLSAEPDPDTGQHPRIEPRRYFATDTPQDWKDELALTGRIIRTWAEIRGYVIDKATGESEAGQELEPWP